MGFITTILIAFIVGFFSAVVAAGPSSFLVFRCAVYNRYKQSIALLLGAAVMETFYCGIAVFSVELLLKQSTKVMLLSRGFGAGICFLVGLYLFFHKYKPMPQLTTMSNGFLLRSFLLGFVLVLFNPSIILTWSVVIAILYSFEAILLPTFLHTLGFIGAVGVGTVAGGFTMVFFAHFYKGTFTGKIIKRTVKFMGIFLMLVGLYFLYTFFHLL